VRRFSHGRVRAIVLIRAADVNGVSAVHAYAYNVYTPCPSRLGCMAGSSLSVAG
jgi:hypothetical protein